MTHFDVNPTIMSLKRKRYKASRHAYPMIVFAYKVICDVFDLYLINYSFMKVFECD